MGKQLTHADFPVGSRVVYRSDKAEARSFIKGHHFASLGMQEIVVHLSATPLLTGVILPGTPAYMTDSIYFRPDGWPLPRNLHPSGFMPPLEDLEVWPDDKPRHPCVFSTPVGHPVTKLEVERLVNERAEREARRPPPHERSR